MDIEVLIFLVRHRFHSFSGDRQWMPVCRVNDGIKLRGGYVGQVRCSFIWLLVIVYPAGMGDGDARLCLLLGLGLAWFGWGHLLYGLMAGFVLGSVVGIGYAFTSGQGRKTQLPFGPWLGSGALLVILIAPHIPVLG